MSVIVLVHAIAASGVVLLAPIQVIRPSKDAGHRVLGRSWVVLMYLVCVSGMFIYTLTGGLTIFHALAIFTFGTTTIGVIAIRKRIVPLHVGMMIGSWLGATAAGAFAAFVPGREIPALAATEPTVLWTAIAIIVVACTVWVVYVLGFVNSDRLDPQPT